MWSTLGITASTFNLGALAFWMPTFLTRARAFHGLQSSCPEGPCHSTDRCRTIYNCAHAPPKTNIINVSHKCNFLTMLCSLCSYIFGIVTIVTGILGGSIGTVLSRSFRDKVPYVDPLICAVGLLGSVPCFISSIFFASLSIPAAYVRHKLINFLVSKLNHYYYCYCWPWRCQCWSSHLTTLDYTSHEFH